MLKMFIDEQSKIKWNQDSNVIILIYKTYMYYLLFTN